MILILSPLANNIPLCALAAILFAVAYNMSDIPHFLYMITHAPRPDILILFTTFLLTIFTNLVVAVNIGVILAMLLFIRRMSQLITVEKPSLEMLKNELKEKRLTLPDDVIIYSIQGPFFFGVAEKFERAFAITHSDPKIIIFRLNNVPFMDITGLQTFNEVIEEFYKRGVLVYLCEANVSVNKKLQKIGIKHWISDKCIFATLSETIKQIQLKYKVS